METETIKVYVTRLVGQLTQAKVDKSVITGAIANRYEADESWLTLDKALSDAKNKRKMREREVMSDAVGKEMMEKKKDAIGKVREFKGLLSSALETYAKETGEVEFKLENGKTIQIIRQFSFKAQQMSLFY